jgi:hypothetical protein
LVATNFVKRSASRNGSGGLAAEVVFGVIAVSRRDRLRQRFGPEYDRLAGERGS